MPTYDYRCRECGNTLEVIHGMTEDGPTVCQVCGGPMRRVLFPTGIIFKGSGFYRNDSRAGNDSRTGSAGSGSSKPSTPDSGASTGSGSGSGSSDRGSSGSTAGADAPASTPSPSTASES